ncbi:MAG: GH92 family glycosyl hydrolase [Bacteroidetes bacterium]|jgi:predicted alpha-1,2-mannosidase|nr:GH92 family glycosyl hydrolase [Bacteroidota bacterium]
MKNAFYVCLTGLLLILGSVAFADSPREPVDFVRPDIGGISLLLTTTRPMVQLPHGYPQVTPVLNPGITDSYLATKIYGFPAGGVSIMPDTGSIRTDPGQIASSFDRDFETRTPYYYKGLLGSYDIEASYTVGHFAIFYRFGFPSKGERHISIMMDDKGWMQVVSPTLVQGSTTIHEVPYYFYLEFSQPIEGVSSWHYEGEPGNERRMEGERIGFTLNFDGSGGKLVEVKAGLSFISLRQAERNLNESVHEWDFESRKEQTKAAWNNLLGKIRVEGGTEKQKTIFYTSLYRAEENMMNITEDGRYYSGFDHKVHFSHGRDFYTHDQLWDTFRCEHPLQLLLDPKQQEDMIQSLVRMYEQWGWLPSFPRVWGEFAAMIGDHADELIADTYFKGYRDFDVEKAYEAMKKEALHATMLPWRRGPMTDLGRTYLEKGFFPALKEGEQETNPEVHPFERRQAVSVTLEASYDDWCIAQMAKALGHTADYELFMKMAHNYRNVFNKSNGFMAPKSADGEWVKEFNPILPSGPGGRDYYAECNAWVWTFNVPQDVAGLIDLYGGRKPFLVKLDSLFEVQYGGDSKYTFLAKFPDMTGLIGNYAQGNEPSFDIAYMYDFAGEPWKTQKMIREIMEAWYNDTPLGLPGDDDQGAMGAWYVFSAMGFYPFCPGAPYYVIGTPIFRRTTIRLSNGKTFTIIAHNVSVRHKYIQSATLNGKPLDKPWFTQMDIENGGVLELQMGPRPNRKWGSADGDAPPSMSNNE